MNVDCGMDCKKALSVLSEIEKFLISKGVWYKVEKEHCPDLKFIRFEGSIKVKA